MTNEKDVERDEVEAALAARAELGRDYEPALVDAFAERVERAIEARVDARMAERRHELEQSSSRDGRQLTLGIVSLGTGIPLTAIAGGIADTAGVALTWAGIAIVNAAYAWGRRRV